MRSPELRQARATMAPGSPELGRGCHGELDGEEEAMNPQAERGERW
jgi:hypothetical protein